MTDEYPSDRSLGRFTDDQVGLNRGFDAQEAQIPWIDPHGHHQSLTWREHEEFEVTGCVALVMAGGIANQVPYRPLNEEDIRAGWDRTIRMSHTLSRSHAFDAYAAVGVHTSGGPIDGLEHLYSVLTQYAVLDEVVAISETGISMVQDHEMVTLEDQREIIRRQFQIAADHGIPVILHTPTVIKGDEVYASVSTEAHDSAEPLLDPRTAKLDAVKIDLEEARKTDIAESQIVFSHARQSMASWILENTECFVSFTVGNATRDISPDDIARTLQTYGPDRIMIDSDSADHKKMEPFAVKRTIIDLLKMNIDPEVVRQIVYDNPCSVFDMD